jgi:hypothetical protein
MSPTQPKAPLCPRAPAYQPAFLLAHTLLSVQPCMLNFCVLAVGSMGLHGFVLARMAPRLTEGTNQMQSRDCSGRRPCAMHATTATRARQGVAAFRDGISCTAGWYAMAVSVRYDRRRRYARRTYSGAWPLPGVWRMPRRATGVLFVRTSVMARRNHARDQKVVAAPSRLVCVRARDLRFVHST